tara:strand:+ start:81 stop:1040 length:960 start_codon:yes stop_codon:yes gene_type:complete
MSYIGKSPAVGNFQVCDAISVVNGQASYTMQVDSVNVVPESANHMLVSLNGILQKPNSSFTVSSSTITFASNLATGDVIDFIMLLGNVLDIGTPSDSTVTNAKTNFVSTSSSAGLQIKGDGTTDGTLQLNCSQNSHGIKLASPEHSASQSYKLIFPSGNVTAGKFLKVDSVSGSGTTGIGTMTFADAGGGKINQVLNTTSVVNNTTSSDVELMSLAITPSATSSKIFMLFSGTCQMGADEYASWDFYRGSLSSGTKILDGGQTVFNGYNNIRLGFSMHFLDSPNTTSATTYTVVGSPVIGTIQYGATATNTLTLMEVLA